MFVCFLRIQSVQSVIHNPTQLSGRGFPCIFYSKLLCVTFVSSSSFSGAPKWKLGRKRKCVIRPASPLKRPYHMPSPLQRGAPRRVSITCFIFVSGSFTRAELCPFPFENLTKSRFSAGRVITFHSCREQICLS